MAEDSLCGYVFQPMVNLVTMLLDSYWEVWA